MALGLPFQTACRYQDKAAGALSALDNGAQKICAERIFRRLRRRKIKCRNGNPALAQKASLREARSKVEPSDRHAGVNEAAKGGRGDSGQYMGRHDPRPVLIEHRTIRQP